MDQERTLHPAKQRHSLATMQISVISSEKLSLSPPNTPSGQPDLGVAFLPVAGGWNWVIPKVPSNPNHSVKYLSRAEKRELSRSVTFTILAM